MNCVPASFAVAFKATAIHHGPQRSENGKVSNTEDAAAPKEVIRKTCVDP